MYCVECNYPLPFEEFQALYNALGLVQRRAAVLSPELELQTLR
jgi:hypothetical protein